MSGKKVLCLRTCKSDLTSHGGFQWNADGDTAAPDWRALADCGHGLHGLLRGEGDGGLLDWSDDAKWLVVEVEEDSVVSLGGKVKFPTAKTVFVGNRFDATSYLIANLDKTAAVVGSTLTGGNGSTLTGGDGSTLTFRYFDDTKHRYRLVVVEPGENGILVDKPYRLDSQNKPALQGEKMNS